MKVVINGCFGGFSLSPHAVEYYYGLKGRKAYFFTDEPGTFLGKEKRLANADAAGNAWLFYAYDTPNPPVASEKPWKEMTMDERKAENERMSQHDLDNRDVPRHDPDLVKTVEVLGEKANGRCARLEIVDIPFDGPEGWHIHEYDGSETVEEDHRSWG